MLREVQIDSLANFLVSGLIAKGVLKPRREANELVACVIELMSDNFEAEARIDEEAARMAEELARKDPRADPDRLRAMLRERIAKKKDFVL
jgi:hypothetical protein